MKSVWCFERNFDDNLLKGSTKLKDGLWENELEGAETVHFIPFRIFPRTEYMDSCHWS